MRSERDKRFLAAVFVISCCVSATGCRTMGPRTIARDRFDYSEAISTSWKQQMMLNLVKLRYCDVPVFLDVSSIISQYSLETALNANFSWNSPLLADSQAAGGSGRYIDRPTITYSPLTGEKFTRNLLTPIPPASIFALVQAGWPIDRVFRLCVQSINGIDNHTSTMAFSRQADPDFYPLISVLRQVQQAGGVGIRVERTQEKLDTIIFFDREMDQRVQEDLDTVKRLLRIDLSSTEIELVYGRLPKSANELAILSRSMMEILLEIASSVDVPREDLAEGRVTPTLAPAATEQANLPSMIQIYSGDQEPDDVFVSVKYGDHWFWIDDHDPDSKGMLSFLMVLFSLAETGGPANAPLVTIPAG